MSGIRSALLGGTAAILGLSTAQAADLPVKKAAPIEYVRVCGAYGAGFFYIPGTDTCLRISGRARFEAGTIPDPNRSGSQGDALQMRGLMRLSVDARTQTDYGTLRAFVRGEFASRTGTLLSSATQLRVANAFPATGQDTFSRIQNFVLAEKAFVQFAGLTAGRASSFFDFYAHDYELIGSTGGSDISSTNLMAYTKTFEGGVSATLSMEDPNYRRQPVYSAAFAATTTPAGVPTSFVIPTTAPSAVILGTDGGFNATSAAFVDAVQRSRTPDFVGALRYDQPWGSAQLSGAFHETNVGGFLPGAIAAVAGVPLPSSTAAATLLAARGVESGAQSAYGWAVQGGVKINLPMIAPGDGFYLQGSYAEGAMLYTGYTYLTGSYASNITPVQGGAFQQYLSDAVINPLTGRLDLTHTFTVVGSFLHYWTPEWRSAFFGSYGAINFGRNAREANFLAYNSATSVITSSTFIGSGALGSRSYQLSPVLRDTEQYIAGASLIWSPVKDLDIGIEGTYIGTTVLDGRVADITRSVVVGGLPLYTVKRYDATQIRMRIQRDF